MMLLEGNVQPGSKRIIESEWLYLKSAQRRHPCGPDVVPGI